MADGDSIERVGPYRILREIAQGGMGVVYLAEQTEPIRRRVALKLIRGGLDSDEVLARFEAERRALALMRHPNIAQVFEAGTTDEGRPYFVMEYVPGQPITEYCDRAQLDMRERLRLFTDVCRAVQHAHQKGIIHRDIKPSNILVEEREGRSIPKVIDFGLAKATDRHLTERSLFTQFGQVIGTPAYMSPEQADAAGHEVDSRSDVYSLGIVLYELLTGAPPFDPRELLRDGLVSLVRKIVEEEPPRPSTKVSSLGLGSSAAARARRTDPRRLVRQIRGELDWITLKSLEKSPARRYQSASEFAADIERFLRDEPVDASPPGAGYRVRKFARRYRAQVMGAVAVLLSLVAGLVVSLVLYGDAKRSAKSEAAARREADRKTREATAERDAKIQALTEATGLRLAAQASLVARRDPGTALILATAGAERHPSDLANSALSTTLRSCEEILTIVGHEGFVHSIEFSPDGQRVVTASADWTVRIWDVATGREHQRLDGHEGRVNWAGYSPDGSRILSVSDDRTARLWDAGSGSLLVTLRDHWSDVKAGAFRPDGACFATGGRDMHVHVYDARTNERVATLLTDSTFMWRVGFANDGVAEMCWGRPVRVADPSGKAGWQEGNVASVDLLDRAVPKVVASEKTGPLNWRRVAVADSGGEIAVAGENGHAFLFESATGRVLRSYRGHEQPIVWISFSPDDRFVATCSTDRTARIWRGALPPFASSAQERIEPLSFSPDDQRVVVATPGGGPCVVYDVDSGREAFRLDAEPDFAVFLPDGRGILALLPDGSAQIHDEQTGLRRVGLTGANAGCRAARLSPDGRYVATIGALSMEGAVWDARSGARLHARPRGIPFVDVRWSSDGKQLAFLERDGAVQLVPVPDWDRARRLRCDALGATTVRFGLNDSRLLIHAAPLNTAALLDSDSGRVLGQWPVPRNKWRRHRFSDDGFLVLVRETSRIRLVNARDGSPVAEIPVVLDDHVDYCDRQYAVVSGAKGSGWWSRVFDSVSGAFLHEIDYVGVPKLVAREGDVLFRAVTWRFPSREDDLRTGEGREVHSVPRGGGLLQRLRDGKWLRLASRSSPAPEPLEIEVWDPATRKAVRAIPITPPTPGGASLKAEVAANDEILLTRTGGQVETWSLATGERLAVLEGPVEFPLRSLRARKTERLDRRHRVDDFLLCARDWIAIGDVTDAHSCRAYRRGDGKEGDLLLSLGRRATHERGMRKLVQLSRDESSIVSFAHAQLLRFDSAGTLRFRPESDRLAAFALAPDSRRVLTITDGLASSLKVRIWSLRDLEPIRDLERPGGFGALLQPRWSPDGSSVAVVTNFSNVYAVVLWDPDTGKLVRELREPAEVREISFSPDGRQLLTTLVDGRIRQHDRASGKLIQEIPGATEAFFSPGGSRIVVNRREGGYEMVPAHLLAAARARRPRQLSLDERSAYGILAEREDEERRHREQVAAEAKDAVERLFERMYFARDVVAAIRAAPDLSPEVRDAAVSYAKRKGDRAPVVESDVTRADWDILIREPEKKDALLAIEARWAIAARQQPHDKWVLSVLGAAQYRLGRVREAEETLARAVWIAKQSRDSRNQFAGYFLAMARHRLQDRAGAVEALGWAERASWQAFANNHLEGRLKAEVTALLNG